MSGMHGGNERWKSERGQAAVLAAMALFSMVVFLGLATNMGILANDRIRIQNTADLTAYAGAFEQARTMNRIAEHNLKIYNRVQQLRETLNYGPAYAGDIDAPDNAPIFYWRQPPCFCQDFSPAAEALIKATQAAIDVEAEVIVAINKAGQISSQAAARRTAGGNFFEKKVSKRHVDFFEDLPNSPTYGDQVVDLEQVDDTMVGYNFLRSCPCCDGCCLYPQVKTQPMNTWFYKSGAQGLIYFPAMVKGVPKKNFVDFRGNRGYFSSPVPGDNDILYGYAAAKPFEGMMGTSNPDNGDGQELPEAPVYPPSDDYIDYFRAEYRARIAGIQEDMGNGSFSTNMAELIAADSSEPQFQDKTEYFTH